MNYRYLIGLIILFASSCNNDDNASDSNIAPVVTIVTPETDIVITKGDLLDIQVNASDADGQVDTVYIEFNGENIAQITSLPYAFTFNTYAENIGTYSLKAIASDNEGKLTTSNTIEVEIVEEIHNAPVIAVRPETFVGLYNIHLETEILDAGNVTFWESGVCWNTTGQPIRDENLMNYDAGYSADGITSQNASGLESGTTYYFRAYTIGSLGITYSDNEIAVQTASDFYSNTGTFADARDGEVYNWVTINGQTWMAENLRLADCSGYEDPSDTLLYGKLCSSCPDGWRMPTKEEYRELVNYLGGDGKAAKYLKSDEPIYWDTASNATNETLFSAVPGGYSFALDNNPLVEYEVGEKGYYSYQYFDADLGYVVSGYVTFNDGNGVGFYDNEIGVPSKNTSSRCIRID